MERPSRGRLFGVCCATDTSSEASIPFLNRPHQAEVALTRIIKTLNCFITSNIEFDPQIESFLVVLDRLDRKFTEPRDRPFRTDLRSTPFKGKTPRECGDMLEKLVGDTGSDVNYEYAIIIDERTARDGTVLAAVVGMHRRDARTVRVAGEVANGNLLSWIAGSTDVEEDAQRAASTADGVLRYKAIPSKKGGVK